VRKEEKLNTGKMKIKQDKEEEGDQDIGIVLLIFMVLAVCCGQCRKERPQQRISK